MAERFGSEPQKIQVAVGPAIGPCCYEVDTGVRSAFSIRHDGWPTWARAVSRERWMLNLPQANLDLLVESGIRPDNIALFEICTHCESELFYSHRRDNGTTGRQIAFIMLKP
jgi:copper oxidase (laccase) domain-containing protein